jgi:phosphoribosylglycinamide formyltransferase-1
VSRLAVLASGAGSNLQALLDACAQGELDASVAVVVSNNHDAGAVCRAARANAPTVIMPMSNRRDPEAREQYDRQLADIVAAFDPALVVLAGWMLILGSEFLARFPGKIINVHPALLPTNGGAEVESSMGLLPALRGSRVVRDALKLRLPVTGATVHVVTSDVDSGPVILRKETPILPADSEETLHARIKRVEHDLLPRAVQLALNDLASGHSIVGRSEVA